MHFNATQLDVFRSVFSASKSALAFAAGRNVAVFRAKDEKGLTASLLASHFLPETNEDHRGEIFPTSFWRHAEAGLLVTQRADRATWTIGDVARPLYVHELDEMLGEKAKESVTENALDDIPAASPAPPSPRPSGSCEWHPTENRSATNSDPDHAPALWIVGADSRWRLCEGCAGLPQFRRLKKRIRIDTTKGLFHVSN